MINVLYKKIKKNYMICNARRSKLIQNSHVQQITEITKANEMSRICFPDCKIYVFKLYRKIDFKFLFVEL